MSLTAFADKAAPVLPPAHRIQSVNSSKSLEAAIEAAQAGDRIVLEDGEYDGLFLNGLAGTKESPIVFAARNRRKAVINGSYRSRNLKLSDCGYLSFYGIRFTEGEFWGVTVGPAYSEDTETLGCRQIRLIDCEFDHAGQTLVKINGNSSGIEIRDCEFHHSGMKKGGHKPYAEGLYVGDGSMLTDRSNGITIMNNYFHDIGNDDNWGEAIDLKRQIYDVRILGNRIEDVVVNSDGAISALMDPVDYPANITDPSVFINGNTIRGVRKREGGWNGAGICIGANGIHIEGNAVSETAGPALLIESNASNTTGLVYVGNNVFHGEITANHYGRGGEYVPIYIDYENNQVFEPVANESD